MPTIANPAAVTVSSTPIIVLAANPRRKYAVICQTSANAVRVGNSTVAATTGARLGATGTTNDRLVLEGKDCPTEAIYAIREGGSDGTVTALEVSDP